MKTSEFDSVDSLKKYLQDNDVNAQDEKTGDTKLHNFLELGLSNERELLTTFVIHGASPYIKNKKGKRVIESEKFQNYLEDVLNTHQPDANKKRYNVYLAGPEVFLKFNGHAGSFIKAQILLFNKYFLQKESYNFFGIFPFDSLYRPKNMDYRDGSEIFKGDVDIMNRSSAVIANMAKFRGPGMDGGTAFEMGFMYAQNKVVVGYYDERPYFDNPQSNRLYSKKVREHHKVYKKGDFKFDENDLYVEGFNMPDNLMMVASIDKQNPPVIGESSWEALFLLKEKFNRMEESLQTKK